MSKRFRNKFEHSPRPTIERLRQILDYDPQTGHLTWRMQLNPRGRLGERAGCALPNNGRRIVSIDGYRCYEATIIWAWVTGSWPDRIVDHIDVDPSNNRWANLRLADFSQQNCNQHLRRDNTSGVKGVWQVKKSGRRHAEISVEGTKVHLGSFASKDEAAAVRRSAAEVLHGAFARHE